MPDLLQGPDGSPVATPDLSTVDGATAEVERDLPAPTLIDSTPWTPAPTAVEVPGPHVDTDNDGNIVVPQMSTETKELIGTKVDDEGKRVGKIDLEQLPVMEAYVQNMKAAIAEGQAGIDKANEAFAAALALVEAGPQHEFGQQLGINEKGGQVSSRKMDMDDPVDAARVQAVTIGRAQYAAAVDHMASRPSGVVQNAPAEGDIEDPADLLRRPIAEQAPADQPMIENVPDLSTGTAEAAPAVTPAIEEMQPEQPQ